jgi:hypothetical protein
MIAANFLMAMVVLPRLDTAFLAEERWGGISLQGVGRVWAVVVILVLIAVNRPLLRARRPAPPRAARAAPDSLQ